jgi:HSP20 family protein
MSEAVVKTGTAPLAPRYNDPFQVLRSEMDQLFDDFLGIGFPTSRILAEKREDLMPQLDVKENDKSISIEAELPGMSEKDVELTLRDGILSISGEKKFEKREDKDNYHVMERRYGNFRRSLRLPDTIDESKVAAKFEKGVLTVTVPKKAEAVRQTKKIEIKAA